MAPSVHRKPDLTPSLLHSCRLLTALISLSCGGEMSKGYGGSWGRTPSAWGSGISSGPAHGLGLSRILFTDGVL